MLPQLRIYNLHNYFDYYVYVSIRPFVRHKIFFTKSTNVTNNITFGSPLTPGVDPRHKLEGVVARFTAGKFC